MFNWSTGLYNLHLKSMKLITLIEFHFELARIVAYIYMVQVTYCYKILDQCPSHARQISIVIILDRRTDN